MTTASELRALASLRDYTDEELTVLANAAPGRRFAAGAPLCEEGTPGHSAFLLVSGEIEVLKADRGVSRVIAKLGPGAFVGQIALIDRGPRTATLRAATAVVACELSRDVFEQLLNACSPLAIRFQTNIAVSAIRQLRSATERLVVITARSQRASSPSQPPPPADEDVLAHIQMAATEWGLSLDELDAIEVVTSEAQSLRSSTYGNRGAR